MTSSPTSALRFQSSARINTGCNFDAAAIGHRQASFNPQPASTRAATCIRLTRAVLARVSILSPHQHGLQPQRPAARSWGGCFNPQPASTRAATHQHGLQRGGPAAQMPPRPRGVSILSPHQHGLQPPRWLRWLAGVQVSILSPHQHGLQLATKRTLVQVGAFQSSARINTGCNVSRFCRPDICGCFNPQPASTRAATRRNPMIKVEWHVSILSPHQHGLQRHDRSRTAQDSGVSILSPHQHGLQPNGAA